MRRNYGRLRTKQKRSHIGQFDLRAQEKKNACLLFLVVDENVIEVLGATKRNRVLHLFDKSLVNLYKIL